MITYGDPDEAGKRRNVRSNEYGNGLSATQKP